MRRRSALKPCPVTVLLLGLLLSTTTVAEPGDGLSSACRGNAGGRLDSIEKSYYPEFQREGASSSLLFFARKDLEAARFYLHPESQEGFHTPGARCSRRDAKAAGYAALRRRFAELTLKVEEMERSRGVTFKTVTHHPKPNHLVYIGKDGKELEDISGL